MNSVRKANILMLCLWLVILFSCAGACQSVKNWEQSGKTDTVCNFFSAFFAGAQVCLPLFGPLAPEAQIIITTGQGITDLLCKASDAYAASTLKAQAYAEAQKLNQLGTKAGIK